MPSFLWLMISLQKKLIWACCILHIQATNSYLQHVVLLHWMDFCSSILCCFQWWHCWLISLGTVSFGLSALGIGSGKWFKDWKPWEVNHGGKQMLQSDETHFLNKIKYVLSRTQCARYWDSFGRWGNSVLTSWGFYSGSNFILPKNLSISSREHGVYTWKCCCFNLRWENESEIKSMHGWHTDFTNWVLHSVSLSINTLKSFIPLQRCNFSLNSI